MRDFYVEHFADYHEIEGTHGYTAIELGCFPTENQQYNRYFGLFYKGRRPSLKVILEVLEGMVRIDQFADEPFGPGDPWRTEWLEYEVRGALGLKRE